MNREFWMCEAAGTALSIINTHFHPEHVRTQFTDVDAEILHDYLTAREAMFYSYDDCARACTGLFHKPMRFENFDAFIIYVNTELGELEN